MSSRDLYKFGPYTLDAKAKVLMREEQSVSLTRKGVETLQVLVENAGQVVTKEELLKAIWPDRVVEEANLTQNIATVRKALSAEAGSPAYIETFPGRGYRLTGPATFCASEDSTNVSAQPAEPASLPIQASSVSGELPISAKAEPATKTISNSVLWLAALTLLAVVAAVAAKLWPLGGQAANSNRSKFSVSPITRLAGEERQPTLSADGNKLAFLWQQGDGRSPSLCIQELGQGTQQILTPTGEQSDEGIYHSPAWSPDGRALAYLRTQKSGTDICIRNLTDHQERVVSRFEQPNYGTPKRMLDWSSDGQWLVVAHSSKPEKPNGLYLVSVATGEQRKLTEPEAMVGGDTDPQFSPDSKRIIYVRNFARSHHELFLYDLEQKLERQITSDNKQISSVNWASDGAEVLFASNRGGEYRLWRLTTNRQAEPKSEAIYNELPIEFSVARKAETLVYAVEPQNRNIWQLDLQQKSWTRLIASSAQDASPQYSYDGQRICFRSDRSGQEQLFVSDTKGQKQEAITTGTVYPSVGHWSPDGQKVAYNNSQTKQLFVAEQSEGGLWKPRELATSGVHPVFSLDGEALFAGTTESILRVPLNGAAPNTLLATGGFSLGLTKDGEWLYFMRAINDSTLWKVNVKTAELKPALNGLVPQCTSCWALAKNGIYYLGSSSASFDAQAVYFQDFATGRVREIIKYPEPLAPVGSGPFSLSPDERYLLVVRIDPSESDILRVTPFR